SVPTGQLCQPTQSRYSARISSKFLAYIVFMGDTSTALGLTTLGSMFITLGVGSGIAEIGSGMATSTTTPLHASFTSSTERLIFSAISVNFIRWPSKE